MNCATFRSSRWGWLLAAAACGLLATAGCGNSPTKPNPGSLTIQCPVPFEVASTDGIGANVTYVPVAIGGRGAVSTVCSPPSGTMLPVGAANVSCTASDSVGQVVSCSFAVRVLPPPRLKYTRLLAFGDSLTEGVISPAPSLLLRLNGAAAYPARLQVMLAGRYTAQRIDVLNRGVGGEELVEGRDRLPRVLDADRPEALLLLEGINNITRVPTSSLASDLESMVRSAQRRNVQVLLALLLPVSADRESRRPGSLAAIQAFNQEIRRISQRFGLGDPVDLNTPFAQNPSLLGADGLHPTETGYVRIAEIFFSAIKDRWEMQPSISTDAYELNR